MATTDNGSQVITFKYQQEGTAEGFNKLLLGVIPTGVISGGELIRLDDSTVQITTLNMVISDGNVTVHVQTTENATVYVSTQKPYIVATYDWAYSINNYVSFEAMSLSEIPSDGYSIILGKCEFSGGTMSSNFDYTRRTWSSIYLNNSFLYENEYNTKTSSFNVTSLETEGELGFNVSAGSAIISGKEVTLSSYTKVTLSNDESYINTYNYINTSVSNGRIDIVVLMSDGSIRYIMGDDSQSLAVPKFPSNGLVLAKFTYSSGIISKIYGHQITNIYNNNYMSFSPTVGEKKGNSIVNEHTLYL